MDVSAGPQAERAIGSKGARTRARILAAAEETFGRRGFHDASIAEITRGADVAQGSFYVYFPSKLAAFEELIRTRGDELHTLLRSAAASGETRAQREAAGFRAFFSWIAEHRWLFRVVRQAEFVNRDLRDHWYRAFAEGYAESLRRDIATGELPQADPEVLAWAVMGMADFVAMRFIVWDEGELRPEQLESFVGIALRAIAGVDPGARGAGA